jgi:DNA invertase Pin-like site-specific DNA recombinase
MRYAIYARRSSSEKDERQVQSIDDQLRLTRELAARLGLNVAFKIHESVSAKEPYKKTYHGTAPCDASGPGGSGVRKSKRSLNRARSKGDKDKRRPARAGFARLLELVESGQVTGIVAWHPDRLSRNEIDAASLTYLIRSGRLLDLQFCNYTFNNSPEGVMMLQMALSQSQYQSSKQGVDVTRGVRSKVEKGWAPRKAPPGYRNDTYKEKGRKTISADPERFQTIRKVWDLALTGSYSTTQILDILNNQWRYRSRATKTRQSGPMALNTLYKLLTNVFYTGSFLHAGELHQGKHPAMITMWEFETVQKLRGLREERELPVARPHRHEFAFTGMIRCQSCQGQVTAQVVTKKKPGQSYVYYHCRTRGGACGWKNIRDKQIEDCIASWLDGVTVYPEFIEWAWQAHEEWAKRFRSEQGEKERRGKHQIKALETQLENLLAMKLRDLLRDDEYLAKKQELVEEKKAMEVREEESVEATVERVQVAMQNVTDFMTRAAELFRAGDAGCQRRVLAAIGSNFCIQRGNLVWEPHPLLVETKIHYKPVEAKFDGIKRVGDRLQNTKKSSFEPVISIWGRIWQGNQTLIAEERITFPNLADFNGLGKDSLS